MKFPSVFPLIREGALKEGLTGWLFLYWAVFTILLGTVTGIFRGEPHKDTSLVLQLLSTFLCYAFMRWLAPKIISDEWSPWVFSPFVVMPGALVIAGCAMGAVVSLGMKFPLPEPWDTMFGYIVLVAPFALAAGGSFSRAEGGVKPESFAVALMCFAMLWISIILGGGRVPRDSTIYERIWIALPFAGIWVAGALTNYGYRVWELNRDSSKAEPLGRV
ncbi:MAG: hypothetical protein ACAI35_12070 [Candidatus Methylacidiphilales bacterium]